MIGKNLGPRRFLLAAGLVISAPMLTLARAKEKIDPDEGVTAPEDLMKEHGVLNRCLLIYEEGMRRINSQNDVSPEVFSHMAQLVRTLWNSITSATKE